ncbi:MAG: hypothetical protein M1834_008990 [Cirrosporium novae-zelandiae]|nr:MAG: hypothetical protein M1834_008990 [Cirrosporium novae-zelandiae]
MEIEYESMLESARSVDMRLHAISSVRLSDIERARTNPKESANGKDANAEGINTRAYKSVKNT